MVRSTQRVLVILIALSLVACASASSAGSHANQAATATPVATSDPTAPPSTPTLKPTPQPTPKPTPKPTANPDSSLYVAFATHVLGMTKAYQDRLQEISDAVDAYDFEALAAAGSGLYADSQGELAWLTANPSRPCYSSLYGMWRSAISQFGDAGRLLREGAANLDVDKITEATSAMDGGGKSIVKATSALESTKCG